MNHSLCPWISNLTDCCLVICKLHIAARAFNLEILIANCFPLMITISYHISITVFETLHCSNMEQDRLVGRGNLHRRGRRQRTIISNEVRAIIVDHVVNRGFTMAEAARLLQPNLQRSTVSSIIRTFRQENRAIQIQAIFNRGQPGGGRPHVLTDQQELAVVEMVRARNDIRLSEIKQAIENSNDTFANVPSISLPTIARLLKKHQVSMKQIYLVPFERNNVRVKQLRSEYIQRVMELDAAVNHHKYIFVDEAGFNLAKTRRRGRNLIGQRATIQVPGQRGGNISMCAAISEDGVVGCRPVLGSYNTEHLIVFLNELEQACQGEDIVYVVVWDNVSFHHAQLVQEWFQTHPRFMTLYLPPYSPFLNPIEEFFSTWRWKVYDRHPHEHVSLLQAMCEACGDITAEQCQAWIRHARRFFPRCLNNEDIHCDVDENLWPNVNDRLD
ncbi:SH2 domain protein 1A [Sarotherodon galilaeus]